MARRKIVAHILPDVLGGDPQREFAQGGEISLAKEICGGGLGTVGNIYLSGGEALQQFAGGQVHEFYFRLIEDGIRHGLVNHHAAELPDNVRAAADVLDV